MCNNDLRTKLEYFSKDYDEEREMEPRPGPARAVTPPLRAASHRVCRRRERVVGEETQNRGESRVKRNIRGGRISKEAPRGNRSQNVNLPLLLVAHIRRRENGLRTRSLVEHLSTDLLLTYKGLIEKTYTWVEAREVATNGVLSDRRDSFEKPKKSSCDNNKGQKNKDRFSPYRGPSHGLLSNLSKSPREILATKRATKSFEPPPKMFKSKQSRDTSTYCHFNEDYRHDTNDCRHLKVQIQEAINSGQEGKKDKSTTPVEAPILMINREDCAAKNTVSESIAYKEGITFPRLTRVSNAPVIIEVAVFGRKVGRVYMDSESTCEKIGIVVSTIHGATKFHTKKESQLYFWLAKLEKKQRRPEGPLPSAKKGYPAVMTLKKNRYERQVSRTDGNHQETVTRTFQERVTKFAESQCGHLRMDTCRHDKNSENHNGPNRNAVACKEAKELTKAEILRKVKHQTWVANPIMVKKNDGRWRMCVDFTDINKSCPKDCYPLPEIDWKIESLAEFYLKCFLDAYKGYHQIQIEEGYEDKTTFFVGEGFFCYGKMPFGLKNAGATYQRLVDKVFSKQIERNLKAYVDDMVIKSTSEERMLKEGPFLGHIITKKGIKSNPSKIKAVTKLEQPRALKYIQSLNEKLAALILSYQRGKKDPLLSSRVLQGANLNYPTLEKLILALVHAARRLRKYFQGHTIMVLTGTPIKQALTGSKKIGRVAKWAIKLGEHDIVFLKRDERETPADFLPEIPFDNSEKRVKEKKVSNLSNECKLYTDGASSSDAPPQTDKIIEEIHEGSCGFNAEPRLMVVRITKQGYYWPSMYRKAAKTIQDCDKCKEQSAIRKARMDGAITVGSTLPFSHWGIHILGPLPMALGGL
nr:hypothetical protein [Tanacetum cinerariifolium]